ncbi:phosphate ABC transporter permease subunit PstC [Alkalibaculum sp. M08DMB]|uniref:Phosphate transport system permease protein n=1 Tax=Alkalibaculum sporogenes TaxID=2655001 RepID=A0A6A7K9D5_9FIRM|nr:phosphate ABC transporter permease subunit PstC [Alkalibaculum sporogenes]MPW26006.1 phosphate ABC transporter permease subunit PstC [Alkalibaculum sporogenes]
MNLTKNNRTDKNRKETFFKYLFLFCAFVAVISVFAITFFVFARGLKPFMPWNDSGYSLIDFLSGVEWRPGSDKFGILYMIIGSLLATIGAITIGVPIGLFTAVFIAELAPKKIANIVRPAVELLAGIPSILYGVFGLGMIVKILTKYSPNAQGQSLLATILVLTIMILPTVITMSETAIRAVPSCYRDGSLALGASKIQTVFKVIIPAAKSGIFAGVVLGIGRAIGETMAVMLVSGNPIAGIPTSLWDRVRPLTTNIALEMGYASGTHQDLLFSTGVVLFIFIMIINLALNKLVHNKIK